MTDDKAELRAELMSLYEGLKRRAEDCAAERRHYDWVTHGHHRLRGKEAAYAHAAELLLADLNRVLPE